LAKSVLRVTGIKLRRLERFARFQPVSEIERIEAAGHAHLPVRRLLDADPPVSAPGERSEPDATLRFIGGAFVDSKPRVDVVAGMSSAALEHLDALMNRLAIELRFRRPTAA